MKMQALGFLLIVVVGSPAGSTEEPGEIEPAPWIAQARDLFTGDESKAEQSKKWFQKHPQQLTYLADHLSQLEESHLALDTLGEEFRRVGNRILALDRYGRMELPGQWRFTVAGGNKEEGEAENAHWLKLTETSIVSSLVPSGVEGPHTGRGELFLRVPCAPETAAPCSDCRSRACRTSGVSDCAMRRGTARYIHCTP